VEVVKIIADESASDGDVLIVFMGFSVSVLDGLIVEAGLELLLPPQLAITNIMKNSAMMVFLFRFMISIHHFFPLRALYFLLCWHSAAQLLNNDSKNRPCHSDEDDR
jgi:hypothetical protein